MDLPDRDDLSGAKARPSPLLLRTRASRVPLSHPFARRTPPDREVQVRTAALMCAAPGARTRASEARGMSTPDDAARSGNRVAPRMDAREFGDCASVSVGCLPFTALHDVRHPCRSTRCASKRRSRAEPWRAPPNQVADRWPRGWFGAHGDRQSVAGRVPALDRPLANRVRDVRSLARREASAQSSLGYRRDVLSKRLARRRSLNDRLPRLPSSPHPRLSSFRSAAPRAIAHIFAISAQSSWDGPCDARGRAVRTVRALARLRELRRVERARG